MTATEPSQPLTDAELARIRVDLAADNVALHDAWLADDAQTLLAEVDRLRSQVTGLQTTLINAHEAGMSLGRDVERLEAENSALLRKLEDQYRHRAQRANEITRLRATIDQFGEGQANA